MESLDRLKQSLLKSETESEIEISQDLSREMQKEDLSQAEEIEIQICDIKNEEFKPKSRKSILKP